METIKGLLSRSTDVIFVTATISALRFMTMPCVLDVIFWIVNVISFFAFLKLLNRSSIVVSIAFNNPLQTNNCYEI